MDAARIRSSPTAERHAWVGQDLLLEFRVTRVGAGRAQRFGPARRSGSVGAGPSFGAQPSAGSCHRAAGMPVGAYRQFLHRRAGVAPLEQVRGGGPVQRDVLLSGRPNPQMQPTGRTVSGSARARLADGEQRNVELCGRPPDCLQLICKPLAVQAQADGMGWSQVEIARQAER